MSSILDNTIIGGRYELREHLATGGMAVVYGGWDVRLRQPVAVKVLRDLEAADDTVIARFQREARAAAALQHPHIVEVYDFFEEDGCYFLIMERVDGPNLKQHLSSNGPMEERAALRLAMQICDALEAAHDHGFIHRDIKPQNILLAPTGEAKLADFGIVHIPRETGFTSSGTVFGTADYISPEQAQGLSLGPPSDFYSLGVVLFEMLTGALPFSGTTPMAVAIKHATAPAPPLRRMNPLITPCVERVVLRAMRKDPERRYPSARAMCAALQRADQTLRAGDDDATDDCADQEVDTPLSENAPAWRILVEQMLNPGSAATELGPDDDALDDGDLSGQSVVGLQRADLSADALSISRLALLLCVAVLLLAATLALRTLL